MPISLHSALIPSMQQVVGAVQKMVDKAEAYCDNKNIPHNTIIAARLTDDMFPFAYQVKSCLTHSAASIAGVFEGFYSPDMSSPPETFAGLRSVLSRTVTELNAFTEDEMEELATKDMLFEVPGRPPLHFNGQDFLLSFSQPNFYFHASTAYDILRMKGVQLSKMDYLGKMRIKS